MGPFSTNGILMNLNQQNLKIIIINYKGTKAWNILRKATNIIRNIQIAISTILHMRAKWGIDMQ
jgi:hypothetical protein